jgi:hypothetical protein
MRPTPRRLLTGVTVAIAITVVATTMISATARRTGNAVRVMDEFSTTIDLSGEWQVGEGASNQAVEGTGAADMSRPMAVLGLFGRLVRPFGATRLQRVAEYNAGSRMSTLTRPLRAGSRTSIAGASAAAGRREVTLPLVCQFSISASELYNFTFEATILNSNNNQLAFNTDWLQHTSGYESTVGTTLTDPEEGIYTCKVKWWAYDYYLGEDTATWNVQYDVPTGETTFSVGWYSLMPTMHEFRGQPTKEDVSFKGRKVRETDPGGGVDGCWAKLQNGNILKLDKITNPPTYSWLVGDYDLYGPDRVGYGSSQVQAYRQGGAVPCETSFPQQMEINVGPNAWQPYKTNTLKAGITATTVWAERDGIKIEHPWQ